MARFPKSKEQEEKLKDKIFDIYNSCINATSSDRRQTLVGQLWEYIYKWCRDFLPYDVDKLGLGIGNIAGRITNKESKANVPKDKNDFFAYLNTSIKKEQDDFLRKYGEDDISSAIHIPKGQKQKVKNIKNILRAQENKLGKILTPEEEKCCINEWYKDEEAYQKYIEIKNTINVSSINVIQKTENSEANILDISTPTSPYIENISDDPLDNLLSKFEMKKIKQAIKEVLNEAEEKANDYRALLTLSCIKNNNDYSYIADLLDSEMIETYLKTDKKPTQKEIFFKLHSDLKESSAETKAANTIDEFRKKLEVKLKGN